MDTNFSQSGNITVIAGLLVSVATHFGFSITVDQVVSVAGAVLIVVGVIKQMYTHYQLKKLAKSAGVI